MEIHEDMIVMKDGRVMVMRSGEMMPLEDEMTMSDGTKVRPNGQLLMIDGAVRMMQEGETLSIDRKMTDVEDMPDRDFKEAMEDEELRDDIK